MASTPSASALSAVLRCRGTLWARNPPTKRPGPAERTRPARPSSAWEVGGRLTVTCASPQADGHVLRGKDFSEINNKSYYDPKRSCLAPGAHSALVRSLTHRLTPNLPGIETCSRRIQVIHCGTYAAHVCNCIPLKGSSEVPAAVWKVSIASPCLNAGQLSSVRTGLKSPCVSLTALLSHVMCVRLLLGWTRADDATLSPQEENSLHDDDLQEHGQIVSSTSLTSSENDCGQSVTEDRPD